MTRKKIGIIGLGKIGLFHLSILNNIEEAEIVGFVDEKGSAKKTVQGMGMDIPFLDTVDNLIRSKRPDGLFVCVPPAFNLKVAQECLEKGISLFLEKPIAATLEDAKKLTSLLNSQKSLPTNAVGYMVAYYPTFQKAKKLLEQNALGRILHYHASLYLGEVFKKQEGWRQNPKISGGGSLAVVGSHLLYVVQLLFGMPNKIRSNTFKLFSQVEDMTQAQFEHPDGLFGEFSVSWSRPGYSDMGFQIQVEGTQGYLEISENTVSLYSFENHPQNPPGWKVWYPWDLSGETAPSGGVQVNQQGYAPQDYDFVTAIGTGRKVRVPWSEGLKVQKMIEAIYLASSKPGTAIPLPD